MSLGLECLAAFLGVLLVFVGIVIWIHLGKINRGETNMDRNQKDTAACVDGPSQPPGELARQVRQLENELEGLRGANFRLVERDRAAQRVIARLQNIITRLVACASEDLH